MKIVEAILAGGVFRPLHEVTIAEHQRIRLTIEPTGQPDVSGWMQAVREFQQRIVASHGGLPDSIPDIAADCRRHG